MQLTLFFRYDRIKALELKYFMDNRHSLSEMAFNALRTKLQEVEKGHCPHACWIIPQIMMQMMVQPIAPIQPVPLPPTRPIVSEEDEDYLRPRLAMPELAVPYLNPY